MSPVNIKTNCLKFKLRASRQIASSCGKTHSGRVKYYKPASMLQQLGIEADAFASSSGTLTGLK